MKKLKETQGQLKLNLEIKIKNSQTEIQLEEGRQRVMTKDVFQTNKQISVLFLYLNR